MPCNPALAKTAGNEDAVVAVQARGGGCDGVDFLGFDPFEDGLVIVRETAVEQGFAKAFVGVFELNVFPDHARCGLRPRDCAMR